MLTEKEFVLIRTQTEARAAAMTSARHWAADDNKYTARKTAVKFARDSIKAARKANRKIVAAKRAGTARPVSVVLAAVLPLMETFAKGAADRTAEHVADVSNRVAAEGLDVAFPEGDKLTTNEMWNRDKVAKRDRRNAARAFAVNVTNADPVKRDAFVARTIEHAVFFARAQFLGYAWKLDSKVGEVTAAKLTTVFGVWGESFLDVTKADGSDVRWKTQTITNYSVLGNAYFQWPTRIVKM